MDLSPQKTTVTGLSDKSWLFSEHGVDLNKTVTLDLSTFDAEDHYPDGSLRSGLVLAKITASGLYGPYDDDAVDGRAVARGHLYEDEKVNTGSTKAGVALVRHGGVIEANLPTNHGLDAAAKTDLAGAILYS